MLKLRMPKLQGIFPAMITPFAANEDLDEKALKETIDYLIKSGVHGIMCLGSTGENVALSRDEKKRTIELTVKQANKRVPIIAGTGTNTTKLTIQLTQDAKEAGADAAMIVTPYYAIATEEGIYEHYKTIAKHVDLPIVVYNIPQATMVNITPSLLARLVEDIDSVVGIKESSGNTAQLAEMISLVGDRISMFTGSDASLFTDFILGCNAAILAIANIAPKMVVQIYDLVQKGDIQKAKETYHKLLPVALAIDGEANFVTRVKEMVRLQGRPAGFVRKPYLPLKKEEIEPLRKALKSAELI